MALLKAGRIAEWMLAHPKATVGAAGLAGIYKAHPWRRVAGMGSLFGIPTAPWSTGSYVSEAFLGDPDARAKIMHGTISQGLAHGAPPGANSPPQAMIMPNGQINSPDGSLVLGLYNARLK